MNLERLISGASASARFPRYCATVPGIVELAVSSHVTREVRERKPHSLRSFNNRDMFHRERGEQSVPQECSLDHTLVARRTTCEVMLAES